MGDPFLIIVSIFFIKVRSSINKDREPYKIYSPDKKGNYQVTDDAKSLKLKKKIWWLIYECKNIDTKV